MNNSYKTLSRHNMSFIHNINPLTWLKQLNNHAKVHLRALLASVRNLRAHFFPYAMNFDSRIALARKAHCQKLKTLRKLRPDVSVICPQFKKQNDSLHTLNVSPAQFHRRLS